MNAPTPRARGPEAAVKVRSLEWRANLYAILAGLAAAWIAFDLLVWAYGESPRLLAVQLFEGTWGTAYGAGQVLFKATPILFSGVAVHFALRAGLFNIGTEGQITVASLVVGTLGARISPSAPPWLAVPSLVVAGMLAGALWALVPALLRALYGAHEVISTIMMNRIADSVVGLAFAYGLAEAGSVHTPRLRDAATVPRLERWLPGLQGSAVSVAVVLAVVVCVLSIHSESATRVGREIGLVGQNPEACKAERIPVRARLIGALVISGAIAALASTGTVLGYKGYYEQGLGAGAGFTGVAVALLGRGRVLGLLFAALLFGTLAQGGLAINADVPMELMDIIQAIVILAVALGDVRIHAAVRRSVAAVARRRDTPPMPPPPSSLPPPQLVKKEGT